jgi:hypothetical protein
LVLARHLNLTRIRHLTLPISRAADVLPISLGNARERRAGYSGGCLSPVLPLILRHPIRINSFVSC